jgi:hypothetical protein
MKVRLHASVEPAPGCRELPDGWRGLLDFGEVWTKADAECYPYGPVPEGRPLTYGCELTWDAPGRATLTLLVVTEPRSVMAAGASFVLREGHTASGVGTLC